MATRKIETKLSLDGEKEWRSQMSSVNSALKTLDTELKLTSSEFRNQANSMAALTAKQDILQRQYDQQAQKVADLKTALEEAQNVYADAPEKSDRYQSMLNTAMVKLNGMSDELERNRKLIEEAANSQDGCATSIDKFGNEVKEAGEESSRFGDILKANLTSEAIIAGVKALASAFGNLSGAMKDLVVDAAAYADDIMTTATVTGLSTDALQEYRYMAELTDVSVDTITGSLSRMIRNMDTAAGGSGAAAEAFDALGVSIKDQNGFLRNNQEVFAEALGALGQIENETQRDAYAMALFGKSAQDLNPLIAQGADGLATFAQEAHAMGYVLNEDSLNALGAVDDAMQRFQKVLEGTKNNLAEDFAPSITSIINGVTAILSGNVDEGIALVEEGIEQFGTELEELGPYAEQALELLVKTLVSALPELVSTGADVLEALIEGVAVTSPEMVPVIIELIMTIVTTLLDNTDVLIAAAIELAVGIAVGLIRAVPSIAAKVPQIITAIVNGLAAGIASISDAGAQLIYGLWNGISNMGAWIGEKVRGFGQGIVDSLKDFFGIHSPATKHFPFIGEMSAKAVGIGFTNEMEDVTDNMANELESDIRKSVQRIPSSYELSASINAGIAGNNYTSSNRQMSTAEIMNTLKAIDNDVKWIMANGMTIVLDDGTIVGRWLPLIDKGLGQLAYDKERGM